MGFLMTLTVGGRRQALIAGRQHESLDQLAGANEGNFKWPGWHLSIHYYLTGRWHGQPAWPAQETPQWLGSTFGPTFNVQNAPREVSVDPLMNTPGAR